MCSLWFYVYIYICNKQDERRERLKNAAHEKCTYLNEFNTILKRLQLQRVIIMGDIRHLSNTTAIVTTFCSQWRREPWIIYRLMFYWTIKRWIDKRLIITDTGCWMLQLPYLKMRLCKFCLTQQPKRPGVKVTIYL